MDFDPHRLRVAQAQFFVESLGPDDFHRLDEDDDTDFYSAPRMVQHLDSRALRTVTDLVDALVVEREPDVLDLMASWDSHLPPGLQARTVTGLGLNAQELAANERLTERVVHDLNQDPRLPFADVSFDAVILTVSIDYLVRPIDVLADVARVLRPGGLLLVVFSDRMFEPKATRLWRRASEQERVVLVEWFIRATLQFSDPHSFVSRGLPRPADDRHAHLGLPSDPVFAVWAERSGERGDRPERPATVELSDEGPSDELVAERLAHIDDSRCCPHCEEPLSVWSFPESDFIDAEPGPRWVCFNDACPYVIRGFHQQHHLGTPGHSYRFMYDPERDKQSPLPIPGLDAFREGILQPGLRGGPVSTCPRD